MLALKANGKYNQYVKQHQDAMNKATPASVPTSTRNAAHRGPAFLPWHREFLRRLEQDLQAEVPGVALPYWDWASDAALADPATGTVWGSDLMGGDGDPNDSDRVATGPFKYDASDPNAWTIAGANGNDTGNGLQRDFAASTPTLPTQANVTTALAETPYDSAPWHRSSNPSFRNRLEGWIGGPALHNRVHVWVGGSMLPGTSPNDPVFFLHHCFVDKLWADWQALHPSEPYVPAASASADLDGHRLNDAMYPWSATPADMLNHRDLGYSYDTDAPIAEPQTPALTFNDVPEGETTVRAAVFSISSCNSLTLEIISGPSVTAGPPGTTFATPLGSAVTVPPDTPTGRVWISFTGTDDGDAATGTVTIRANETGEQWVIPISANTIARPTVAAVLVLDKSGSMDDDAGDGRKRIEVLRESAPVFVDLLRDDDGIGIVSFDHDAYTELAIEAAGPLVFGGGRVHAKAEISNHNTNPGGATSIGDGVERAKVLWDAVTGYDEKVMVVLTDGRENRAKYIADVASIVGDRVFGIGLGTAQDINPTALTALTNGTGGYVLMTGTLDTDDQFILAKYYLQILAGVTNANIVLDPDGHILPDQVHRIPFVLNETDISVDVILLTSALPGAIRFVLETPDGDIVDPGVASTLPSTSFSVGTNTLFYRITLPVPIGGIEVRAGRWHAVLTVDKDLYWKYLASLDNDREAHQRAATHGLRYSLNVHSVSNLQMKATLAQDSQEPGATLHLRAVFTEYGLPVTAAVNAKAELQRPDGTTSLINLSKTEDGIYEGLIGTSLSGIYRIRVLATGHTLRGRPFTREQLLTGAVWRGGDDPHPTSEDDPRERDQRLCKLMLCLLRDEQNRRALEERGFNVKSIEACLKQHCAEGRGRLEAATIGTASRLAQNTIVAGQGLESAARGQEVADLLSELTTMLRQDS